LLGLAIALPHGRSWGQRAGLGAMLMVALAALTLGKANIVVLSGLLILHVLLRHGVRLFSIAALAGAGATVILLIVPCLYFGSWSAWQEWYRFVYGSTPAMLVRPIATGNYATPVLLSSWLGGNASTISLVLMILLALSLG